ncbi:protein RRP5 homolog [Acanthaster planci]|uniref:Protein RRP5 homolog n=1 Tax=Acanthaster planci TaxID=133434 RepID=A0A8B7YTF6_ACAPL|nr:protein RRP5 homolog [Acanthaster planci]
MDEESFPRGRGKNKIDSSLTQKPVKRKHDQLVLFEDDGASGKERKVTLRKEKKSKKPKLSGDDDEESLPKQFEYDEETEEHIDSIGERPKAAPETVPKFSQLTHKTISADMLILGVVKEVHEYEIVVSLPNMMTGYVQITDVSFTYTKLLEMLGDDSIELSEDMQDVPSLQTLFTVGHQVVCKVKSVGSTGTGRQRIQLTLDPQAIHSQLNPGMLKPGMIISGSVSSIEDHGYVVDVGIPGVNSFLSSGLAEAFIMTNNQGQPLSIAQPIKCLIKDVKSDGRSLVLSANPSSVAKATAKMSSHDSFVSLVPGTKVKATIQNINKDNIRVEFLSSYRGCIDQLHFEDNTKPSTEYEEKQVVRACVIFHCPHSKSLGLSLMPAHTESPVQADQQPLFQGLCTGDIIKKAKVVRIDPKIGMLLQLNDQDRGIVYLPHIADTKVTNPNSLYHVGSKVVCRILDFNLMDGIATVSMKQSVLDQPFLGYHDIQPGCLVEGTLTAILEKGLSIKISDHVSGFVPRIHMADVIIHKPQGKFTVGELLELRVLYVNPERRRLLLTHKKSLVHSTLPVITSYDQPRRDMILHGFIISIKDFGYLVRFYNDITGLIPRSELCTGPQPVPDGSYFIGQVVKCRVIKTYSPEAKRITLSLRLSATEDKQTKEIDYKNPRMGKLTDVKVTKVRDLGLEVSIHPEGTPAFLPKVHLSDFVENCSLMLACYEKGDTITNAMHWSFSPTRNCAIVTCKPMLIEARQNKELVRGFSEVQSGTLVMGVVKRVMPYGIFIELPNNVVGLAPKAAMSDDFISSSNAFQIGQTLRARVSEVDHEKSRFLLSLKSSICLPKKGEGQSLLEKYFHERDVIIRKLANKEGWEKLLEIQIGSEVTARITQKVEGGVYCKLPNKLSGYIPDAVIEEQADIEEGSKVKACVLHVDLSAKVAELTLDPEIIKFVALDAKKKKTPKKSKSSEDTEAVVAMVKDDFILVCLKASGKLAYIPGRRHLNDIRTGVDVLIVGQTIKVTKQRMLNNRILASQFVSNKKDPKPAPKKAGDATTTAEQKEKKKKTPQGVIEAHKLQLGQKVTAVVRSVQECQLNVRVNHVITGRIHVTEITDKMVQNKFPLHKFKEGMELEAKVIGHREVKDHRYLPITHTNFTKLALDLTIRPSKLNDDKYIVEDESLQKQLQRYQSGQTISCVVQKYVENILWVLVTGLLQGKVYQLNLCKNLGMLEHPAQYFLPGSVRKAKVVSVDHQHQVLELTLVGSGSTELTPGTVTNGRILKILSGIGLVIQLPFGYRGRVFLTDLRDHYTENALKGYREKQFVRCCVLEVADKENVALSMRPSAVSKHHDPAINPDISSIQELSVGDVVKGYVKNFTKVGVFVSLSRKLQGRIQLKNLSVSYIKEPEALFPKGRLLTVKVLNIDKKSHKIELSSSGLDTGADDPVPKHLGSPKPKPRKRRRQDSQGSDLDSGLEEPETLSDSEVEVVHTPRQDTPVARLQVTSGFTWDTNPKVKDARGETMFLGDQEDSGSDESEAEAEQTSLEEPQPKKSKKEKQAAEKAEEDLLYKMERELMEVDRTPETAEEFDRLVLSSPDSSLMWVRYMAFHLQSAEIEKARAVAERALKTINFREEQEKLNVWVAFMNLENLYGSEETLLKVFERALLHCEPLKVFQNLVSIYSRTGKLESAEQLYKSMVKRFNLKKDVWISYGSFLMQNGRQDDAHKLMQRSFKSLMPKEHNDVIVKFAQMEFKFGEAERGKTMFENILSNYPKRTDIWSVYLDMMIKQADVKAIR